MTEDVHSHSPMSGTQGDEQFRLLVEGVKDYAIFMLDLHGRISTWNAGAERIKGYRRDEIVGQHFSVFYPQDDVRNGKPDEELRVAAAEGRLEDEGWRIRKDGSRFWANVIITAIYNDARERIGFAKVTRDLTDRREAEREREGLLARLYEAERDARERLERRVAERTAELNEINAELEAFGYTVSHDLRAPLRALNGLTQALVEDYGDRFDESGREYARLIAASSRQMEQLIEDLLAYSRLSRARLDRNDVALDGVVKDVVANVDASRSSHGAEIVVEHPLPHVVGHRATLQQVLTNLVTNALKFVSSDRSPAVRVRAEQRSGQIRLWVEDNGIGIAPEHQARIFNVFERLHGVEAYEGTGVGLAIVRKGVERMGGRVGVESSPGAGSRFWVELPATKAAAA